MEFTWAEKDQKLHQQVKSFNTPEESKQSREESKTVNQAILNCPNAQNAQTGLVNGLYVFDDFISEEESKYIIAALDDANWQKQQNRRVQQYGYEFKYGSKTRIDINDKLGELPDFLTFLQPRLTKILSGFQLNNKQEVE